MKKNCFKNMKSFLGLSFKNIFQTQKSKALEPVI